MVSPKATTKEITKKKVKKIVKEIKVLQIRKYSLTAKEGNTGSTEKQKGHETH